MDPQILFVQGCLEEAMRQSQRSSGELINAKGDVARLSAETVQLRTDLAHMKLEIIKLQTAATEKNEERPE